MTDTILPQKRTMSQISDIATLFVSAFDTEVLKLRVDSTRHHVLNGVVELYLNKQLHQFFIQRNLAVLVDEIFGNVLLRDFILNVSTKLSLLMAMDSLDEDSVILRITEGVSRESLVSNDSQSLTSELLKGAMSVSEHQIRQLLNNNFWLLTVLFIVMFLESTSTWQEIATIDTTLQRPNSAI